MFWRHCKRKVRISLCGAAQPSRAYVFSVQFVGTFDSPPLRPSAGGERRGFSSPCTPAYLVCGWIRRCGFMLRERRNENAYALPNLCAHLPPRRRQASRASPAPISVPPAGRHGPSQGQGLGVLNPASLTDKTSATFDPQTKYEGVQGDENPLGLPPEEGRKGGESRRNP
jgi:hypothetical protein